MSTFKNINAVELKARLGEKNFHLIDVRTDAEIARGIIPCAEKIPLHLLPTHLAQMDSNAPTVFYCQMGGRSAQAAAFAAAQGFVNAYNLQGGISDWVQSGYAVSNE
ncbi:MAG: rhodanese-like domain-containing protein [Candidatus Nitrotoga sp.]